MQGNNHNNLTTGNKHIQVFNNTRDYCLCPMEEEKKYYTFYWPLIHEYCATYVVLRNIMLYQAVLRDIVERSVFT